MARRASVQRGNNAEIPRVAPGLAPRRGRGVEEASVHLYMHTDAIWCLLTLFAAPT